jgi:hypothetical protein
MNAHANLIQAAALAGLKAAVRSKGYEEHEPERIPVDITDPATGRGITATCNDYRKRDRWTFHPSFPRDAKGQDTTPRPAPPTPTSAKDTPPATLAKRLRGYFDQFAPLHQEAEDRRDRSNEHHRKTAETVAALIAAGALPPGPHDREPFKLPRIAGGAYSRENRAAPDSVTIHLQGLTTAQAVAIIRALTA